MQGIDDLSPTGHDAGDSSRPWGVYPVALWLACLAFFVIVTFLSAGAIAMFYPQWELTAVGTLRGALVVALVLAAAVFLRRALLRPPGWVWIAMLLALSLGLRTACVLSIPYTPAADFKVYDEAGMHMAQTWTLGDHGPSGDGLRCFFPPGQVFALGVVYWLFGGSVLAAQLLNVLLASLTVVLIYLVARRMFDDHVARAGSLLAAILPSSVYACLVLGAEVPETFWLLLALWIYARWVQSRRSWKASVCCGLALGAGALVRPTYLLLPIPIVLHLLLTWRPRRAALSCGAALAAGALLAVLPWTFRNYLATGGFVLISSNGGGNLWSGNNDYTHYGMYTDRTWKVLFRASRNDLELQSKGTRKALQWIRAHPARFSELALEKFVVLWASDQNMAWWAMEQPLLEADEHPEYPRPPLELQDVHQAQADSNSFYFACCLAAVVGLVRLRGRLMRERAWMVIPLVIFYFSAVHMVFESQGKYHYMLVPIMAAMAALAVGRSNPALNRADPTESRSSARVGSSL